MGQRKRKPKLSLCMIVRNVAGFVSASLESIQPWVDELVVVDTGSVDATKDVISKYTDRIFDFPWCDDFSAARNESIRHATGEWLFWMDSDDVIDEANGKQLRELAYGDHPANVLAYVVQVVCPAHANNGATEATVVDHVKLFRNRPDIRFQFRIHEQLLPDIRKLGGDVCWSGVQVVHANADHSDSGKKGKYERDLRILELELKERPDHSFALFNFGMTYSDMGEHQTAAEYLERCLAVAKSEESQVPKAYALLANSYDQLGELDRGWKICQRARELFPDDPELLFREGKVAHDRGDLQQAERSYRQILAMSHDEQFRSIDLGITGYKARHNLALCYQDKLQPDQAELQWRMILDEFPDYVPAWRALANLLLEQGRLVTVEVLRDQLFQRTATRAVGFLIEAKLSIARERYDQAKDRLAVALQEFPDDPSLLEEHGRIHFEHGSQAEAGKSLMNLVRIDASHAAAMHNLGALHMRVGDVDNALAWYERSLSVRPASVSTQQEYAAALATAGRSAPSADPSERPEAFTQIAADGVELPQADDGLSVGASETLEHQAPDSKSKLLRTPQTARRQVVLVTIGYNLPGATQRMFDSAMVDCHQHVQCCVFSHSIFPEKQRELEQLAQRPEVTYFNYGTNRGLANSWNEGILWGFEQGADSVLVVNEDVLFSPGDLELLVDEGCGHPEHFLVMGRCFHDSENRWDSSEYGCFVYNRRALDVLGMFDQNFFPIYCEDSDYRRRAELAELEPFVCQETRIQHQGSASLKQPELAKQNQKTYAANRQYYARKWGGDAGRETFARPFNDQRFTVFIDPRVRHQPYPGCDRTDHDIVRI